MKETISALIIVFAIFIMATAHTTDKTTAPEHWDEDYCEYIYQLEMYVEFLHSEIEMMDSDYISDVLVETDQYWDYKEAANEFYRIVAKNRGTEE